MTEVSNYFGQNCTVNLIGQRVPITFISKDGGFCCRLSCCESLSYILLIRNVMKPPEIMSRGSAAAGRHQMGG